jgi:hypothetical protein
LHPTAEAAVSAGPVVVLSYEFAGAEIAADMLSSSGMFACTSATGIIPLCHSAAAAWQSAEGSSELSALATKAIKNTADTLLTVILAASGGHRWCEVSYASPAAASTFLKIFPSATFVCLHSNLHGVFSEVKRSFNWGLCDSPLWPFAGALAGNDLAIVSRYWSVRTEALLALEEQYPDSCIRLRHEDIAANDEEILNRISARLGLSDSLRESSSQDVSLLLRGRSRDMINNIDEAVPFAERLPSPLLAQVRDLHERLGYEIGLYQDNQ